MSDQQKQYAPVIRRLSEIEMPTPEETAAREMNFRIGAHHAATRLAEALEGCRNINDARMLADTFADLIGEARHSGECFNLHQLAAAAKQRFRNLRKKPA